MTSEVFGLRDLDDAEIEMISGGADDKMTQDIIQAGRDFANALEDAADYVGGFFAGVGRAFTNGR